MDFKQGIYKVIRPVVARTYRPALQKYLQKPRSYEYEGIKVIVQPGVFHPGFFFSTKLFIEFLKKQELKGISFLELGAGSGLISLFAATDGAKVTASDISETAVKGIRQNAALNKLDISVIHSDMFDDIPQQLFDSIVIAPPYYKRKPVEEAEHAWYCGENGEYFSKLFAQIGGYTSAQAKVWMILSSDCDIDMIRLIADKNGFAMNTVLERKKYWETNFIFEINRTE